MSNTMELTNSMPRSASSNRFQVNPVNNKGANNGDNNGTYVQHDETDDFDDNQLVNNQKNLKVQPSGQKKSSIRDKDKQKRDTRTSFSVAPQDETDDSDNEEENLIDGDTKYGRSFRHFTREALPRLDNYRNILSIQAAYRPTLDELHNATLSNKGSTLRRDTDVEGQLPEGMLKFGWFKGVMMRCLLNIWGVMLFLRLSWVVGQAGILQGCFLILTTSVVTTITALSMSAISTNGIIKGGGTYYMISRSLGPQFGAAIGLIFSLANAVACAMYVVGFCESMMDLLKSFGVSIVDGGIQDVRIIGTITIMILLLIVVVGMEWEAKAQLGLLVILLAAIADFFIGTFIGPKSDFDMARGFLGYNWTLIKNNAFPDYREDKGVSHDFFSVFAIFFPAATGILAGANISGDLKDPSHSIPRGTLWAILVTTLTYLVMAFQAGATVARDATGNITLMANGSWDFLDCNNTKCEFGLQNSFQVIELVSAFGPIIYAGCFAATLSSALASLVSAPKVFQALCKDELYPKIKWFAKGYGKNNEPVRGYVLTFFIAVAFILIGELNAIAPLISNFFLAAYMLINFSTFHASLAKPVGWRPQFKYYNMWLSLAGSILCVAVMFLISWTTALLTFACVMSLYLIVAYRKPDVNWGSSTQAQTYKDALLSVQHLNSIEEHVKNYRPQILVLSGHTNTRPILVNFAFLLTKKTSLLVCGHVIKQVAPHKYRNFLIRKANDWFRRHKVKGFYTLVDDADFETGSKALMQATGVGKLKPNILLLGYKNDWISCDTSEREQYFNVLHKALDMHLAVAILRVAKGLDYSQILGDEAPKHIMEAPRTLNANDSSADLMSQNKNGSIHGSCDSLSRNVSGDVGENLNESCNGMKQNTVIKSSSTSDLTFSGTPQTVSGMPDPTDIKSKLLDSAFNTKSSKKIENDPSLLYRGPGGSELPKEILNELTQFSQKRKTGLIDVYWLYDDGGLTLLLPYIINTRRNWSSCKLRVFALANKKDDLDFEQRSMAGLLAKFRIDYSHLKLLSDITNKPEDRTIKFFEDIIKEFTQNDDNEENALITQDELLALQDKTNRHLRLREHLLENSSKSDLVVMTLPMPRKSVVSAPLYMAWLETLSRGLPPFLFVRGNHQSVLTFYS